MYLYLWMYRYLICYQIMLNFLEVEHVLYMQNIYHQYLPMFTVHSSFLPYGPLMGQYYKQDNSL